MLRKQQYDYMYGEFVENQFQICMKERFNSVTKSNRHENIHKHIDFYINDKGVDVKGGRHLDTIWLELKNVQGKNGWLEGKADYICFYIHELKSFCFYKRIDLLNLLDGVTETTTDKKDYWKIYTRSKWARKDQIVKVCYDDIKDFEVQQIYYPNASKDAFEKLNKLNDNKGN